MVVYNYYSYHNNVGWNGYYGYANYGVGYIGYGPSYNWYGANMYYNNWYGNWWGWPHWYHYWGQYYYGAGAISIDGYGSGGTYGSGVNSGQGAPGAVIISY